MTGISVVEFVGGPQDGLRLVEGIEKFQVAGPDESVPLYAIGGDGALYRPRDHVEGDMLFLDFCRYHPIGQEGE